MRLVVRAAAVVLMIVAHTGRASAQDYQSQTVGGSGGAPFTMRCAEGDYLVGLHARSGDWVDAIAPLCARWDVSRQGFLAPGLGPLHGGRGGGVSEIRCDQTSAIKSLVIENAPNRYSSVAMLVPSCASALEPSRRTARVGPDQFGTSIADRIDREAEPGVGSNTTVDYDMSRMPRCNEGDLAVGVFGAAGNFVDRIGLICAPAPRQQVIVMLPGVRNLPSPVQVDAGVGANASATPIAARRCRRGFVWREASPSDFVCVPPESRDRVRQENATARTRVDADGAQGPNTCAAGFVWREAFDGDVVCVAPEIRALARQENNLAASRTVQ